MSWDDGSLYDMKLAELLLKYNISSTFYIPKNNIEGISVLPDSDIKSLSESFEIGAHSIDHLRLSRLSKDEQEYQVRHSKEWLEDLTGKNIHGFCYPGGVYDDVSIDIVKKAGFYYSRTTENFMNKIIDIYEMPTTLQLFNHKSHILLSNIIKSENSVSKAYNYYPILMNNNLLKRLEYVLKYAIKHRLNYLHLWGHSWELNEYDMWPLLEDFFRIIQENKKELSFKTNYECATLNKEKII